MLCISSYLQRGISSGEQMGMLSVFDLILDWRVLGYEENDPQTVLFAYPRSFQDDSILQVIRLEIGALAAWTPL